MKSINSEIKKLQRMIDSDKFNNHPLQVAILTLKEVKEFIEEDFIGCSHPLCFGHKKRIVT